MGVFLGSALLRPSSKMYPFELCQHSFEAHRCQIEYAAPLAPLFMVLPNSPNVASKAKLPTPPGVIGCCRGGVVLVWVSVPLGGSSAAKPFDEFIRIAAQTNKTGKVCFGISPPKYSQQKAFRKTVDRIEPENLNSFNSGLHFAS